MSTQCRCKEACVILETHKQQRSQKGLAVKQLKDNRRFTLLFLLTMGFMSPGILDAATSDNADYLQAVVDYAQMMLEHGRDTYGDVHTPLFAEELDRTTLRMLEGDALKTAAAIPREEWGIRAPDRMLGGANPQHCLNLYQILYALTTITGQTTYAEEADASLKYFFEHCQSPATGLFYWGEHAGWDLRANQPLEHRAGNIHEFYRPWTLWERSWQLAPEACRRFAVGLWEHQIGDHNTGDFSRHAGISEHGPGVNAPYARHGGFYIETWAQAYAETGSEIFVRAIDAVLKGLERARLHEGGYLVGGSTENGARRSHDVSLAISLENAASNMPAELAEEMRAVAAANDAVFTQERNEQGTTTTPSDANLWSNAYGSGARVGRANVLMLRYRQTALDAYRQTILEEAVLYRDREIILDSPVWPGTVGDAVWLMLNAYELTGEDSYLNAAKRFAQQGTKLFLADAPLPKASHAHDHYEAVTNGDMLMMALMRLWLTTQQPEAGVTLIYTDR